MLLKRVSAVSPPSSPSFGWVDQAFLGTLKKKSALAGGTGLELL